MLFSQAYHKTSRQLAGAFGVARAARERLLFNFDDRLRLNGSDAVPLTLI